MMNVNKGDYSMYHTVEGWVCLGIVFKTKAEALAYLKATAIKQILAEVGL